ncbi:MAG TPA: hypothetical protein EYN95_06375 [Methylococcaceae bacterium]|jgi:negative regulator of sigma E activity|nr:hypothetical protein [Methylococcaceae bacterium]
MSEQINAQISEFIDGELSEEASAAFLDILSTDSKHEDTLHRYVAIREMLHPERLLQADVDLVSRVRNEIQDDPEVSSDYFSEGDVTVV